MEDTNFVEEHHRNTATLAFTDFCAKLLKQSLDIAPLNIRAHRMSTDCFERSLVLSLHCSDGTIYWYLAWS